MISDTTLKLEIARKFSNNSWMSEGLLRSIARTADFRECGKWRDSRQRLTMLYKTGRRMSNWMAKRVERRGSKLHDLGPTWRAIWKSSCIVVGEKLSGCSLAWGIKMKCNGRVRDINISNLTSKIIDFLFEKLVANLLANSTEVER